MKTKIIPAILVRNFEEFQAKVRLTENDFEILQIDAIDGQFVANTTYYDIKAIQDLETKASYELHLMVNDPLSVIKQVYSPKISRIIFHIEPVKNRVEEIIAEIKNKNIKAGLALNPETPVSEIAPYINNLDIVLLMTVHPGWAGQGFMEESYDKIRELRKMSEQIEIEVDGGVKDHNLKKIIDAGVNSPAMGSALLNTSDYAQTVKKLKAIING